MRTMQTEKRARLAGAGRAGEEMEKEETVVAEVMAAVTMAKEMAADEPETSPSRL